MVRISLSLPHSYHIAEDYYNKYVANKTAAESYDGTSFTSDSNLSSGNNGQGKANPTPYSAPTTALYVGNPNPPDAFPAASTVEEYTSAAAATQTVGVS